MASSSFRLSAVVPATNRPPSLARCLQAIDRAEDGPDEVIVVDRSDRPGPAAARNAGAERATGDVLVFVDADVLTHSDAFRRIRAAFEGDQRLGAVFGSYDDTPEAPGVVSGFRNLLHHHVHQEGAGTATTFWAGLGAVRRDAFLSAGSFDADRYPLPSVEDIELGGRLAAAGVRIRLDPDLQGTHLKAWSLGDMIRTDFARRGVPWVELLLDGGSPSSALNLGPRHRLSALAAFVGAVAVLSGRPRVATASLAALLGLNSSFYALLLRRRGPAEAAAGVGLHAIHHLTGGAAVVAALAIRAHKGTK